jgi:hypothetical protein
MLSTKQTAPMLLSQHAAATTQRKKICGICGIPSMAQVRNRCLIQGLLARRPHRLSQIPFAVYSCCGWLDCCCCCCCCCRPVQQEGKPRHQCYTPAVLQQIQQDGWNFAAPGGESQKQLEDRMVRCARCAVWPRSGQFVSRHTVFWWC